MYFYLTQILIECALRIHLIHGTTLSVHTLCIISMLYYIKFYTFTNRHSLKKHQHFYVVIAVYTAQCNVIDLTKEPTEKLKCTTSFRLCSCIALIFFCFYIPNIRRCIGVGGLNDPHAKNKNFVGITMFAVINPPANAN